MLSRLLLAALAAALTAPAGAADPPKKVLLVGSPPDEHAPGTHEYMAGVDILAKLLKPVPGVEVTVARAQGPWKDGPELVGRSDCAVIFLTEGSKWLSDDAGRLAAFRALARRGGGLACLHWGMGTREAGPVPAFVELFGGCHGGPDRKHKVVEAAVTVAHPRHPIATGIGDFTVEEEFYYRLKFVRPEGSVKPVLLAEIDGTKEAVAWAWERPDGGRAVVRVQRPALPQPLEEDRVPPAGRPRGAVGGGRTHPRKGPGCGLGRHRLPVAGEEVTARSEDVADHPAAAGRMGSALDVADLRVG